jgi:hypothetical protein
LVTLRAIRDCYLIESTHRRSGHVQEGKRSEAVYLAAEVYVREALRIAGLCSSSSKYSQTSDTFEKDVMGILTEVETSA